MKHPSLLSMGSSTETLWRLSPLSWKTRMHSTTFTLPHMRNGGILVQVETLFVFTLRPTTLTQCSRLIKRCEAISGQRLPWRPSSFQHYSTPTQLIWLPLEPHHSGQSTCSSEMSQSISAQSQHPSLPTMLHTSLWYAVTQPWHSCKT